MRRSTVVIELAGNVRLPRELAAGGVFVPGCQLRMAEECDLVVCAVGRRVSIPARVVYVDGQRGAGLELIGLTTALRQQLAELEPLADAAARGTVPPYAPEAPDALQLDSHDAALDDELDTAFGGLAAPRAHSAPARTPRATSNAEQRTTRSGFAIPAAGTGTAMRPSPAARATDPRWDSPEHEWDHESERDATRAEPSAAFRSSPVIELPLPPRAHGRPGTGDTDPRGRYSQHRQVTEHGSPEAKHRQFAEHSSPEAIALDRNEPARGGREHNDATSRPSDLRVAFAAHTGPESLAFSDLASAATEAFSLDEPAPELSLDALGTLGALDAVDGDAAAFAAQGSIESLALDDAAAIDDSDHDDSGAARPDAGGQRALRGPRNVHERLRSLNLAAQIKLASAGELHERIVLERLYGKNVWETLLRNPRLTAPEVARIARYGALPRVMLELILSNNAWLQAPEVRRALLSNPRLGTDQIMKLLRLVPKHELRLAAIQTAYPHAVRQAAKQMLRGD